MSSIAAIRFEVAERLGVSPHSLYKWVKVVKPDQTEQQASELIAAKSEVLKLRAQLRRVEEERDILKKRRGILPESPSKVPLDQRAPTQHGVALLSRLLKVARWITGITLWPNHFLAP